jgi:chromatin remodeling complex protein RSC6
MPKATKSTKTDASKKSTTKSSKAASKPSSKTASKKSTTETTTTATPVTVTPEVAPSVVENQVVETKPDETTTAVQESSVLDDIDSALTQVSSIRSQCTTICAVLRSIRTRHVREVKTAHKAGKKRLQKNRKPSGFTKPSPITERLAQFIKMVTKEDPGQLVARTQATKVITRYIRENNLQDKTNGRRIIPDKELSDLLSLNTGDELTYFNLQTKINHHFPKKTIVESST